MYIYEFVICSMNHLELPFCRGQAWPVCVIPGRNFATFLYRTQPNRALCKPGVRDSWMFHTRVCTRV